MGEAQSDQAGGPRGVHEAVGNWRTRGRWLGMWRVRVDHTEASSTTTPARIRILSFCLLPIQAALDWYLSRIINPPKTAS